MLKYNLKYVFKQKGISQPVGFLINAGIKKSTAGRLAKGTFKNIPPDTLETLCLLLRCTPNDLLEWTPGSKETVDNTQPLTRLTKDPSLLTDLRNISGDIPYEKLSLFAEKMIEVKKELLKQQ